jgi:hypothetical protein
MITRVLLLAAAVLNMIACSFAYADSPLRSPEAMAALRARAAAGKIAAIGELGAMLQNDKDPTNDIEGRDLLVRAADADHGQAPIFWLNRTSMAGQNGLSATARPTFRKV